MRDLTEGSIAGHLIVMAAPLAIGMLVQTLYYLVDLYFVARLGEVALAGVSAAGNVFFIVLAATQVLGVGALALISHAAGRKDRAAANQVFNQSMVLALLATAVTLAAGYSLAGPYMRVIAADSATAAAGVTFLHFFVPGLALQFVLNSMGAALRGTGIVTPTVIVQMATLGLNTVLAPVLIAGWGTGRPLGVVGAGLASSVSVGAGVLMMTAYFLKLEKYVAFERTLWRPDFGLWRRMLGIGFPAGGEFGLVFFYMAVIYWVIQDFGAAAQAGFGLGARIMQAIFLPAMAIAFATPAVAGQNFGAARPDRVRETFRAAALIGSGIMLSVTLACQWRPEWFALPFTRDSEVIAVSAQFLRLISWNFVATGIIFTCSGMFQALGNTWPALWSMATRLVTFAVPAIWISGQTWFAIEHVWYLSVATVTLQALVSLGLIQQQFRLRLRFAPA